MFLANNSVRWLLRKTAVLPAKRRASLATTLALQRGETGTAVHVPLIQDELENMATRSEAQLFGYRRSC